MGRNVLWLYFWGANFIIIYILLNQRNELKLLWLKVINSLEIFQLLSTFHEVLLTKQMAGFSSPPLVYTAQITKYAC